MLACAGYAPALAGSETPPKTTLNVIAEHDGWRMADATIEGRYYKGRPGAWFLGAWDRRGRVQLARGHTHVIEGVMGWKVHVEITPQGEAKV